MSYWDAIEAVGIEILAHQLFGDWQGTHVYRVRYQNTIGWLFIHYGSCSGCDSWEHYSEELRYRHGYDYEYTHDDLAAFGRAYIDSIMSDQEALENAGRDVDWDLEQESMLTYIQKSIGIVPGTKKDSGFGTLANKFDTLGLIKTASPLAARTLLLMSDNEN